MRREQVDALLASYRENLGRRAHLANEIYELCIKLQEAEGSMVDDMALRSAPIDDMPHGNKTGDPTSRIAMDIVSGKVPEMIREARDDLNALTVEQRDVALKIKYVDGWLQGLTNRESWVIRKQVMDREVWRQVLIEYAADFREQVSKSSLKRIRNEAMHKIYKIAGAAQ